MRLIFVIVILLISLKAYSSEVIVVKKVNSVKEFFQALGNNTEIIIECNTLDFTLENLEKELEFEETDEHWSSFSSLNYRRPQSYYLVSGIVLYQYSNLIIRSETLVNIISKNSYDNILSFENCENISLKNIAIYHTPETCNGSVLKLLSSSKIKVNNCYLNGSGGIGVSLIGTDNAIFNNTEIFNNVFYAVYSINSNHIQFKNCNIYENHDWGDALIYSDISNLTFSNCEIERNEAPNLIINSIENMNGYSVKFKHCRAADNTFSFDDRTSLNKSNTKKSKKQKNKLIIKLFVETLIRELNSDHDGSNYELMSFFYHNYKLNYNASYEQSTKFLIYYYSLKNDFSYAQDFSLESITWVNKNEFNIRVNNPKLSGQIIWTLKMNKSRKIEYFKEKVIIK